jgi:hypothetical protein
MRHLRLTAEAFDVLYGGKQTLSLMFFQHPVNHAEVVLVISMDQTAAEAQ